MFKRFIWIQYRRVKLKIHVFLRQLKSRINLRGGRFYTNNIKEWLVFHYTTYLTIVETDANIIKIKLSRFLSRDENSFVNQSWMYLTKWNVPKQMWIIFFIVPLFFIIAGEKKLKKWIFEYNVSMSMPALTACSLLFEYLSWIPE